MKNLFTRTKITYRRLSKTTIVGRCGKYYITLWKREHGKWDGFDKYVSWWSAAISKDSEYIASEGFHGQSLKTLKKAKNWVKDKLKNIKQ